VTRRGLGRGLDALLSSTEAPPGAVSEVAVTAIRPNPYQPRRDFEPQALEELAASIRVHGLLQPLVVTPEDGGYLLVAGERRWRAAQLAGLERIQVVVRDVGPREMLALAVIENVQRADLNPLEAAEAYQQLIAEFGLSQADVAGLVGKSRVAVTNTVRLLGLAPDVRGLVAGGHLSEGHGRALLPVDDPGEQIAMARRAIAGEWTVRRTEAEVRAVLDRVVAARAPRARKGAPDGDRSDPNTAAAVQAMETALGTRVELRRRGNGGTVVIHFYSEEELAALYDRLVAAEGRFT
jgi:ParB family transcriptional regulator, chromosome partitioning protein